MTQTTTHVNACDASIWLDDAAGTLTDISGSSNRVSLRFRRDMEECRILDSGSYPLRVGCFKDCEVDMRILYTTADDEALDIINTWYHATGVMSARTLEVYIPYKAGFGESCDLYSGEVILEDVNIPASSQEANVIGVGIRLKSTLTIAQSTYAPNWWDPDIEGLCVWAAYEPKGAASFAASLMDLSGNGNDAVDPGGAATPGWDAVNGWTFNGSTQYLTTGFVPPSDQDMTLIVQFSGVGSTGYLCGLYDDSNSQLWLRPRRDASDRREYANGQSAYAGSRVTAGNMCIAGNKAYYNGANEGITLGAWVGASAKVLWFGAANGLSSFCSGRIQAAAIYDCTLTPAQVLAVATEMAAL